MDIFPPAKPSVLILENSPASLARLGDWLHVDYTVKAISRGRSVAQVCIEEQPDLILIDLMRPGNEGLEVCRRLKASEFTRQIPVIFLTNENSVAFQQTMFELGAADYITRPIYPPTLLSRIKSQLAVVAHARTQHTHQEFLAYGEGQYKKQANALQEMTLVALASLAETRDTATGNPLRRT